MAINADHLILDEEKIRKLKIGLKISRLEYRWVPKDLLHIHLLSLGDIDSSEFDSLISKVKKILEQHRAFDLKLNGIWAYPNQKEGRLLWIGVQNSIALRSLQDELANHLIASKDFREEKIFKPILPIVRIRNRSDVTDLISPYKTSDFGKLKVHQLSLYRMVSGGAFPVYEIIEKFQLPKNQLDNSQINSNP